MDKKKRELIPHKPGIYEKYIKRLQDLILSVIAIIVLSPVLVLIAVLVEYEWFIHGATDKIALNGKFVNEVPEGREVAEINDPVYESQIIESIF